MMEEYDWTKEESYSIIEVGQFEEQRDPVNNVASIPSKVCTCRFLIFVRESLLMENLSSSEDSCRLV